LNRRNAKRRFQKIAREKAAGAGRAPGTRLSLPDERLPHSPFMVRSPFIPYGIHRVKAPQAWRYAAGEGVHVAVIDTGVDYTHPDLAQSIGVGYNVLYPHLPPYDDNGHGTHIAGTIAARNLRAGMVGTAPNAVIHPVKAFDHNGSATIRDIVAAIEWSIEHGMQVINMSFGMRRNSKEVREAIRRAHRAGIVIVASAGNDGKRRSDYPARYPEVIAVGATSLERRKIPMSNHGRHIDLYAPGEKVVSTWLQGKYQMLSGTSMAAAYVSGAAAILLSLRPELTPRQVKQLLLKSKTPIRHPGQQMRIGELNILGAVQRLLSGRHMRSGAETPIRRRTLRSTMRTQPARARRA